MPRPPINLRQKIIEILTRGEELPPEAGTPLAHYWRATADVVNLLQYVDRNLSQLVLYANVRDRHLRHLNSMALVSLIEALERFLKELAAVCVNALASCIHDDRFDAFRIQGSALAAHFGSGTLGNSLCESVTWLNCEDINQRFRKLLANPFAPGDFSLFSKQGADKDRFETLSLVWQLRHTVVHNVGVVTQSDAIKLRLLARQPIPANKILRPTAKDLLYLKRFLDESAEHANRSVALRIAELLTSIHSVDPTLFQAQAKADELSVLFSIPLTVAGATGMLPSP